MYMRGNYITDLISTYLVSEERSQVHSRNTPSLIGKVGLLKRSWLCMEFPWVTILMFEQKLLAYIFHLRCSFFLIVDTFPSFFWSFTWDIKSRIFPQDWRAAMCVYPLESHGWKVRGIKKGFRRTSSQVCKIVWSWYLMQSRRSLQIDSEPFSGCFSIFNMMGLVGDGWLLVYTFISKPNLSVHFHRGSAIGFGDWIALHEYPAMCSCFFTLLLLQHFVRSALSKMEESWDFRVELNGD